MGPSRGSDTRNGKESIRMDQKLKVIVSCTEPTRINKYLANAGLHSRRETDAMIDSQQILLNGELLQEKGTKVKSGDVIEVLEPANALTLILNKPVGFISDHFSSKNHPPAIKLLTKDNALREYKDLAKILTTELHVLGRLDADSHGLLVFSNSGVIARQLIGADSQVEKEYLVKVKGVITEDKMKSLRSGMQLDGQPLKEAIVTEETGNALRFILREGKNRQIRRMCEKVDLLVLDLLRVRIGNVRLSTLPVGKWRLVEDIETFI